MARKYPEGYYVYLHIRKSDGQVFYVGKGKHNRAWRRDGRNNLWLKIAKKYGYDVIVIKDGMENCCALTLEKIYISKYRSLGVDLANFTDGGQGMDGFSHSDKTREKIGRSKIGNKNWLGKNHSDETKAKLRDANIGKTLSQEARMKISETHKGREFSETHRANLSRSAKGRVFSQEARAKMSASKKNMSDETKMKLSVAAKSRSDAVKLRQNKPTVRGDGMRFPSATDAALYMSENGYPNAKASVISRVCREERNTAYGFGWVYES